jgi:hypothetical protein
VLHADESAEVRAAAQAAQRLLDAVTLPQLSSQREGLMLSPVQKPIFLREVSFFEGMTIDQLHKVFNRLERLCASLSCP